MQMSKEGMNALKKGLRTNPDQITCQWEEKGVTEKSDQIYRSVVAFVFIEKLPYHAAFASFKRSVMKICCHFRFDCKTAAFPYTVCFQFFLIFKLISDESILSLLLSKKMFFHYTIFPMWKRNNQIVLLFPM